MSSLGTSGGKLHLRLFLEGIEVPVISASVQAGIGSPATASVQIVPSDKVLELKPRTLVHLFFYDYTMDQAAKVAKAPGDDEAMEPQWDVDAGDPLLKYKLFFGGEIVGLSVVKTPLGRQMVLQCADWSTYWDTCYQMFISWGPNGNFLTESSSVWAGGNALYDDILDGHSSVINKFLHQAPLTPGLTEVKGLMGGLIRLLEAQGGVANHIHGVNDFFTIGELMRHLLQQITAEQDDDTALQLFSNKEFWQWLDKGVMSLGELTTFRDLIGLIFKWVYYESVPVTSPMYVPANNHEVVLTDEQAVQQEFKDKLTQARNDAKRYAARAAAASPIYKAEGAKQDNLGQVNYDVNPAKEVSDPLRYVSGGAGVPAGATKSIEAAIASLDTISKGGWSLKRGAAIQLWNAAVRKINEALNQITKDQTKKKAKPRKAELDRLQTQIFRPDCFFAAAPKCNVFFPDQYTQFDYSRNFLQEVTRLRLQSNMMFTGGDALLADYHFAPSIAQIKEIAANQGLKGSVRALLPWELYTGVLPKFESITEINFTSNTNQKKLLKDVKSPANSYSSRIANFNYFKYRFAARAMNVSMKFNPFVAVGFPGALIERPFIIDPGELTRRLDLLRVEGVDVDPDNIIQSIPMLASKLGSPTQYIGMISSVAHSIDQSGGNTSVSMTHARTHRLTEDDFLQVFAEEIIKEANIQDIVTPLNAQDVLSSGDPELLKLLIAATPQNIPDQMKAMAAEQAKETEDKEQGKEGAVTFGGRPNSVLPEARLRSFAGGLFNYVTVPQFSDSPGTVIVTSGEDGPLRGRTRMVPLTGTRSSIMTPDPFPSTLSNIVGPHKGKFTQVELHSDEVVKVTREKVNQKPAKKGKAAPPKKGKSPAVAPAKDVYLWVNCSLHEEVTSKTISTPLPIEEMIRPSWFSALYSNLYIGDRIYTPFFGIGSIVDEIAFQTPLGAGVQGTTHKKKRSELLSELQTADGDFKKISKILNEAKATSLSDIPSIEAALDTLAYIYGEVRRLGLDVHKFIADYTSRPIATMKDIFGSADLAYKEKNGKLVRQQGTPGFHSSSIGDFKDLVGLLDNPNQPLPRIQKTNKAVILAKNTDPRPGRRKGVLAYSQDINGGGGSLGIGLRG